MLHARPDYQGRIVDLAELIPADEPVLLIRGQDICALPAIDAWVEAAQARGADDDVVSTVMAHRQRVADWQAAGHVKVPDLPSVR